MALHREVGSNPFGRFDVQSNSQPSHARPRLSSDNTTSTTRNPLDPTLTSSQQIELPRPISQALRHALLALARQAAIGNLASRWGPAQRLAHRFVAGDRLADAIAAAKQLNDRGIMATLDHLGESVTSTADAFVAAGAYVDALDAIQAHGIRSNVSLKLTQMGFDVDPALCHENLTHIVERAHRHGNFVRIDMEGSAYTQRTLDLARRLRRTSDNVGVVIQAYLYRSQEDVEELIASSTRVRLCKGAYAEPPSIAFTNKADVDRNYRRLMERLILAGNYPAFATHDERLIRWACHFAAEHEISKERFEFQFLYGIRRDLQESLAAQGYNVRVYVPYGHDWYRYFMRRLAERPANLMFLLTNVGRR